MNIGKYIFDYISAYSQERDTIFVERIGENIGYGKYLENEGFTNFYISLIYIFSTSGVYSSPQPSSSHTIQIATMPLLLASAFKSDFVLDCLLFEASAFEAESFGGLSFFPFFTFSTSKRLVISTLYSKASPFSFLFAIVFCTLALNSFHVSPFSWISPL